jgi:hypothetical protein
MILWLMLLTLVLLGYFFGIQWMLAIVGLLTLILFGGGAAAIYYYVYFYGNKNEGFDNPPLSDFLTPNMQLSRLDAASCAAQDRSRELEPVGQYVQRTNNYRRDYPDNCSAPFTELVGSFYNPIDGFGLTVPCGGLCL